MMQGNSVKTGRNQIWNFTKILIAVIVIISQTGIASAYTIEPLNVDDLTPEVKENVTKYSSVSYSAVNLHVPWYEKYISLVPHSVSVFWDYIGYVVTAIKNKVSKAVAELILSKGTAWAITEAKGDVAGRGYALGYEIGSTFTACATPIGLQDGGLSCAVAVASKIGTGVGDYLDSKIKEAFRLYNYPVSTTDDLDIIMLYTDGTYSDYNREVGKVFLVHDNGTRTYYKDPNTGIYVFYLQSVLRDEYYYIIEPYIVGLTDSGSTSLNQNKDYDGNYIILLSADLSSYSTRIEESNDINFLSYTAVYTTGKAYTISNKPDGTYYYRTKTCDSNSICSEWSNVINIVVAHPITPPSTYTISVSNFPATLTPAPTGAGPYSSGQPATVVAPTISGYTFIQWSENGATVHKSQSYSFTVTANRNLVAEYVSNIVTPPTTTNSAEIIFFSHNTGTVNPGGAGSASVTIRNTGSATRSFYVKIGYRTGTNGWTLVPDSLKLVPISPTLKTNDIATLTFDFTLPTALGAYDMRAYVLDGPSTTSTQFASRIDKLAFTVVAPTTYTITTSTNPPGLSPSPTGAGSYISGKTATVVALVVSGYTFTGWLENGIQQSATASYPFTVTGDRNLVAEYTPNSPPYADYLITISTSPSGLSPTYSFISPGGQTSTITAKTISGYTFQKWTENGIQVSTSASYLFTVTENRYLVAEYSILTPLTGTISGTVRRF